MTVCTATMASCACGYGTPHTGMHRCRGCGGQWEDGPQSAKPETADVKIGKLTRIIADLVSQREDARFQARRLLKDIELHVGSDAIKLNPATLPAWLAPWMHAAATDAAGSPETDATGLAGDARHSGTEHTPQTPHGTRQGAGDGTSANETQENQETTS